MEIINGGGQQGRPQQLSPESLSIFQEGIALVFSRWSALQLAVENEWGGRDSRRKADLIASQVISWFTQSKEPQYIDDLEDILAQGLLSLQTEAQDGSVGEVAEELMIMHEECLESNYQSIIKLREASARTVALPHIRQVNNDDDNDTDDDSDDENNMVDNTSMMIDGPESQTKVDMPLDEPRPKDVAEAEDGWVVVGSRRNKGRRN